MSQQPKFRAIGACLLLSTGLILACGLSLGTPQPAPAIDPTTAVLQLQATAMSLQLTQGAANSQQQVPPAIPLTAAPTATETLGPLMPLLPGTIELSYGEKQSCYPRKNQSSLFGFNGAKDDKVNVLVEMSSARPNDPACKDKTGSVSFRLRTPNREVPGVSEGLSLSAIRDYQLPLTTAYYIEVSCVGSGCNAYCIQADVTVEKQ